LCRNLGATPARGRIRRVALAASLGCVGAWCVGAELSINPSINIRETYNDNIRLTSAPHRSVLQTTISPAVRFSRRTETSEANARAQLNVNRYTRDTQLNADDVLIDLSYLRKLERDLLALDAGIARDSTFASELAQTGVVQARRQRTRASASPAWTHNLSERSSVKLGYDLAEVRYQDRQNTNLVNYRAGTVFSGIKYKPSERDETFATLGYSEYKASDFATKFKTVFVEAGIERKFSEVLTARASLGANRVRFTVQDGSDTRSGWLANLNVERRFATAALTAEAGRELNPSGIGSLTETDRLALRWRQKINPRLEYSLSGAWYHNSFVGQVQNQRAERYLRVGAGLNWLASEYWTIEAGVGYEEINDGSGASANSIFVGATYNWPKISLQR
jgi:hypothetical protein